MGLISEGGYTKWAQCKVNQHPLLKSLNKSISVVGINIPLSLSAFRLKAWPRTWKYWMSSLVALFRLIKHQDCLWWTQEEVAPSSFPTDYS